jgi:hypothetical protein
MTNKQAILNKKDLLGFILNTEKCTKVKSNLIYDKDNFCFKWGENNSALNIPSSSGIYFILSHNSKRVQKIGKAEGTKGLNQRLKNYTSKKKREKLDKTATLWHEVMTDPKKLKNQELNVFYYETKPMLVSNPIVRFKKLEANWARSLEKGLSEIANQCLNLDNEMLLSGQN